MLDKPVSDDPPGDPDQPDAPAVSALREALRRARVEAAQQTDVVIDLRATEIARLEILQDALEPVLAEVPREIDLFDVGLVPGDRPRLFVDMVSFVEMGRDRRSYRFMRDGRHGRSVAAESEKTGPIVEAITNYVARRLVERERLLADEDRLSLDPERLRGGPAAAAPTLTGPVADTAGETPQASPAQTSADDATPTAEPTEAPAAKPARKGWKRALAILTAFGFGGALGAVVVFAMIVARAKGYLPV